jgi:nicotinamidase-related amidase
MKNYAVLTSNMQIATANKHEARKLSVTKFLPALVDFLDNVRKVKIPVIHLQLAYREDDPRSKEPFGPYPNLLRETEAVRLLPDILQPSDIVIEKSRDSGFFQSELEETLKKLGVTTVIVTGMQAYSCVQFTAADAYFRGYEVIINVEAIGSTKQEDTDRAVVCMGKYCAKILTSREIYKQLGIEESYGRK